MRLTGALYAACNICTFENLTIITTITTPTAILDLLL